MKYSALLLSMIFPPTSELLLCIADTTSEVETLYALSFTGSISTWYCFTNPPIDATSATPSTDDNLYLTYQSCIDLKVPRSYCLLSSVYQNTCPTPVPSGPSVGVTPPGNCALTVLSFSSTLVRAKYIRSEERRVGGEGRCRSP